MLDFFDEDMLQLFEVERDPGRIASRAGRGKVETGFPLASCSKLIESIQNHCDLCAFRDLFTDAGANWPGAAIISAVNIPSNAFGARQDWPSLI
ncbi:MAG: hypothetical protein WCA96_11555 [Methylocella sp.]